MCRRIETEHLILRPPEPGDEVPLNKLIKPKLAAHALKKIAKKKDVMPGMFWPYTPSEKN